MNLVYSVVSKEYPTYLNDEDIIQCGMLGLCKAAEKWEESKSQFSTFAWMCIRNEIRKEFRNRMKHQNVLSLDYEVDGEDGEKACFGDFLIGAEDVLYIDKEVNGLTKREQQIFELFQSGMRYSEIAVKLGTSRQYIWKTMRKVRMLYGLNS